MFPFFLHLDMSKNFRYRGHLYKNIEYNICVFALWVICTKCKIQLLFVLFPTLFPIQRFQILLYNISSLSNKSVGAHFFDPCTVFKDLHSPPPSATDMVILYLSSGVTTRETSEQEKRATLSVVREENRYLNNSVMILTYALMNGRNLT